MMPSSIEKAMKGRFIFMINLSMIDAFSSYSFHKKREFEKKASKVAIDVPAM